jgi:branched-chain amino acid transport system ATP-binding protein
MHSPVLQLEGVSAYYGGLCAVRDIDLTIDPGECVCLIGPNGAGKTTLLKAISGVLESTQGRVSYLGRDATTMTPRQRIAAGLIHVPEGRLVFATLSVSENLKMGGYAHRGRDLPERIERVFELFPRLRERRSQAAGSLSGGEQQMVAIGRALVGQPKLLMLDEPSMGLAPMLVEQLFEAIGRIKREQGLTVLLVEQNARAAIRQCDYGYVMDGGRIVLHGTREQLENNQDVKEFYLGLSLAEGRRNFRDVKHYRRRKRWLS